MIILTLVVLLIFYLMLIGVAFGMLVCVFKLLKKILGNLCDAINS